MLAHCFSFYTPTSFVMPFCPSCPPQVIVYPSVPLFRHCLCSRPWPTKLSLWSERRLRIVIAFTLVVQNGGVPFFSLSRMSSISRTSFRVWTVTADNLTSVGQTPVCEWHKMKVFDIASYNSRIGTISTNWASVAWFSCLGIWKARLNPRCKQ